MGQCFTQKLTVVEIKNPAFFAVKRQNSDLVR